MNSTPTTAITIDSYLPGHGSIAERDVRIRSNRDVRRGLWEKLSDSYHGRYTDPASQWLGEYAGIFFFWFVAISEPYLLSTFLLPYRFPQASDMDIYYWKVAIFFVFIQSAANWLCLRYFASFYTEKSKDQPRFDQMTDWERHIRGITKDCKEAMPGSRFGWGFCSKCQQSKPPRAHHCPVCERCVLKRDHHCYMTGVCVGYYNQRYFVIFTFYVALASTLGLYFCWVYFYQELYPQHPGMWWFLPVTFIKFVYGSLDHYQLLIIVHLYSLLFAGSMAAGFFIWQLVIIGLGKTDNEIRSKANVRSVTSVAANFRSVFGILWPVNFLFPGVIVFRQEDSGLHWEGLKPL